MKRVREQTRDGEKEGNVTHLFEQINGIGIFSFMACSDADFFILGFTF